MRIETICENRKELVKAMAEILGEPSKYLGPPSFGYQIGGAIVDRDGNIETEDGEMLQKELQRRGFVEKNQEELNLQIPIEGHTVESIRNLIFMIHSKQYLLKRAVGTEVLHMSERLIERLSEEKDADMNRVSGVSGADATAPTSSAGSHTHSLTPKGTIANAGGGASHSNLQPYIVCYMWKRTA